MLDDLHRFSIRCRAVHSNWPYTINSILSHGSLKASGTSVELKETLELGYKIHVYHQHDSVEHPVYGDELHVKHDENTVYLSGSPENTYGPTIKDVFLKIADEDSAVSPLDVEMGHRLRQQVSADSSSSIVDAGHTRRPSIKNLLSGKRTSIFRQARVLFLKRFTIFRNNPMPLFVAISIPILAAGCASIFLGGLEQTTCDPDMESLKSTSHSTSAQAYRLVTGPKDQLSKAALDKIKQAPKGSVAMVDTLEQFHYEVEQQYSNLTPGGFFLGEKPTFAWHADGLLVFSHIVQNLINNEILNIIISSDFKILAITYAASIGDLLIFATIFGLAMAVYPAFLGLYPTFERLGGIRTMHYNNGVRAMPLWLAYLSFDLLVTLLVSTVATIVFAAVTSIWYHLEYLFTVFLLCGIASTLCSYVLSLIAKSQLAVFAASAATQAVMLLVFFIANIATFTYTDPSSQNSTLDIIFFTVAWKRPTP
ncbi:hypothetical protein FZEAL_8546 [Fusarium zealandicum]|uniref:Uncharacterized protein n=1 Tax=Fusarium zealandicum TaxID=1053134 RepID=A0A8H4XHR3_9HYPO|nr:hypothetical protein FZEAL_8546 [Fusarium zealandicum]